MRKPRYTHSISLNKEQEESLQEARLSTGFSIVQLLMAMVKELTKFEELTKKEEY